MTTAEFVKMVQAGEFKGRVVIDNDQVYAYDEDGNEVHDFDDRGPGGALFAVLNAIGANPEYC